MYGTYLESPHDIHVAGLGGVGPSEAGLVEQPDPLGVVADVPVLRSNVEDSTPAAPPNHTRHHGGGSFQRKGFVVGATCDVP